MTVDFNTINDFIPIIMGRKECNGGKHCRGTLFTVPPYIDRKECRGTLFLSTVMETIISVGIFSFSATTTGTGTDIIVEYW